MSSPYNTLPEARNRPVAIIGAGPIGLITALGLSHFGIPVQIFEEDGQLSLDIKAGTILTRTVEVLRRFGAADRVLASALRIDEIGEVDRQTQKISHCSCNLLQPWDLRRSSLGLMCNSTLRLQVSTNKLINSTR